MEMRQGEGDAPGSASAIAEEDPVSKSEQPDKKVAASVEKVGHKNKDRPPIAAIRMIQQAPTSSRLKIRHAVSGNIVCFPGPATANNAWSLPRMVFNVKDLVGSNILMVCEETNTLTKETYLVSAVLTSNAEIAPGSYSLDEVATDGWVSILTGASILPFRGLKFVDKPCADLFEVNTPPTPPPMWKR